MRVVLRIVLHVAGQIPVFGDHDALRIDRGNDAGGFRHDDDLRVARDALLDAGAHEGGLRLQQRHALALHVGAHERAIRIVVLEEGNHAGGDRNHLLGRHVHQVDVAGRNFEEVAILADCDLADEVALVIDLGVRLGDDFAFLLVSGEVLDLVGDATVLRQAIRRLNEAEFVDAGVGRKGIDQTDVRTFGRFNRADAAVVRRMDIADFETGAFAVETTRPERGQAALVRHLG